MKNLVLFISIIITGFAVAQKPIHVDVSGMIWNLENDTLKLSKYLGNKYVDYASTVADKKGNFSFSTDLPAKDYYVIRVGENQHLNIILEGNDSVKVYGDGKNIFNYANFEGSEASSKMNEFVRTSEYFKFRLDSLRNVVKREPARQNEVNTFYQKIFQTFDGYRQRFIADNSNSPALMPVLTTYDMEKEFNRYEVVANYLIAAFPGSPTTEQVKLQLNQAKQRNLASQKISARKPAPNIRIPNPKGDTLQLSDLKGKVVLLDFWASWCGPCRKENPNVVRLYEKYNKDGFEVFSVSFDTSKEKWEAAIAKDGLVWPYHVSELKGWRNAAGQEYQVKGIPFTVLIDQEGNILQTKLRGAQLEQALQQIYGH